MTHALRMLGGGLALALAACTSEKADGNIETASFAPSLNVILSAMTRSASGLYHRDLVPGAGAAAAAGQTVSVHYTGWLINGTQFDSNGPTDPPYTFQLGAGQVIAGWDQGVAGMKVGGRRQLVIPPSLGYGAGGNGPIPPNAILVFQVELVGIQ